MDDGFIFSFNNLFPCKTSSHCWSRYRVNFVVITKWWLQSGELKTRRKISSNKDFLKYVKTLWSKLSKSSIWERCFYYAVLNFLLEMPIALNMLKSVYTLVDVNEYQWRDSWWVSNNNFVEFSANHLNLLFMTHIPGTYHNGSPRLRSCGLLYFLSLQKTIFIRPGWHLYIYIQRWIRCLYKKTWKSLFFVYFLTVDVREYFERGVKTAKFWKKGMFFNLWNCNPGDCDTY